MVFIAGCRMSVLKKPRHRYYTIVSQLYFQHILFFLISGLYILPTPPYPMDGTLHSQPSFSWDNLLAEYDFLFVLIMRY